MHIQFLFTNNILGKTNYDRKKLLSYLSLGKALTVQKGSKSSAWEGCFPEHALTATKKYESSISCSSSPNLNLQCSITGYLDEENLIVYLHMNSMLDTNLFIKYYDTVVERTKSASNTDDFLAIYDEVKSSFVQSMLLLFYISHIVVISLPGRTFDLNYVQYFKAAHHIRLVCRMSPI